MAASTNPDDVLSPVEAAAIIRRLTPGSGFVYHVGDLSAEREETLPGAKGRRTLRAIRLDALASFVQRQGVDDEWSPGDGTIVMGHARGLTTRRKIAEGVYEYIFIRKKAE